jgi:hypothetical protein
MANHAEKNDARNPSPKNGISVRFRHGKLFHKSNSVAATMMGTAAKNEYSVAVFLSKPTIIPPSIVEADLDMPGHMARH